MSSWQENILLQLNIPQEGSQIYWLSGAEHLLERHEFLSKLSDVAVYDNRDLDTHSLASHSIDYDYDNADTHSLASDSIVRFHTRWQYKNQRVVVFYVLGLHALTHLDMVTRYVRSFKKGFLFDQDIGIVLFKPPQVIVFADFAAPRF
jgi:hypothetical protein